MGSTRDSVNLGEIAGQRELGWPDFDPEDYCHRCGHRNIPSWSVDSDRFNAAVEALGLTAATIICPSCFVLGHEKATGLTCSWQLVVGTPFHHIEDLKLDVATFRQDVYGPGPHNVVHNLGIRNIIVEAYLVQSEGPSEQVPFALEITDANMVCIHFGHFSLNAGRFVEGPEALYRVVIRA